jgi:hypothetical protein
MMRLPRQFAPGFAAFASICLGSALAQAPPQQYPYPQQQPYPAQQPYPPRQQLPQQPQPDDPDAPNHGAARISVMTGDVSVRRGDNGDYVAAAINAPLVVGDRVLTGPNGRAEVQFDAANMIRLAPNSEIRLAELAYLRYQIQLARGVAMYRVLRTSNADVEVSTPQASIRPKKDGAYRVTVQDDGQSEVTVRKGEVEVFTPRGAETLYAGKAMMMRGTVSEPEFQVVAAAGEDDWDRWNVDRDRILMQSVSGRYVSPDVYGTEDLDANGRWVADPSYGNVWTPTVPPGWAPYRAGRWVWVDYYGWTWVSSDPWGWAPYHYGSWFISPGIGWCWYPGGFYGRRHYWSPALVGFVGFGPGVAGVGFGFGFGSIGWFPLGPFESFHPWWGRGFGGGYRNVTVINNINGYRNARVGGAGVTSVSREGFTSGAQGRAFTGDMRTASLVHGQLPAAAGRQSTSFTNRGAAPSTVGRSANNQSFFSSRQSSAARPQGSGAGTSSQGGWRRFGEPNSGGSNGNMSRGAAGAQQSRPETSSANRGWGSFGAPASRSAQGSQNRAVSPSNGGGWQRSDPSSARQSGNVNSAPRTSGSVRISPPVVRERPSSSTPQAPHSSGGGGSHGSSHSSSGSHHGR